MTEQVFLKKAKQAIKYCDDEFSDYPHSPELLQLVWMSHILGSKKAIFFDVSRLGEIFEVTYNGRNEEFYVDKYEKKYNSGVKKEDLEDAQL